MTTSVRCAAGAAILLIGLLLPPALRAEGPDARIEDTTDPDALDAGETTELDEVGDGEEVRDGYRVFNPRKEPDCQDWPLRGSDLPGENDYAAWGRLLHEAERRLEAARAALDQATANYTRVRTRPTARGQKRVDAEMALEAARVELEDARCALPAYREAARRAGVPPGIIRGSGPASPAP